MTVLEWLLHRKNETAHVRKQCDNERVEFSRPAALFGLVFLLWTQPDLIEAKTDPHACTEMHPTNARKKTGLEK